MKYPPQDRQDETDSNNTYMSPADRVLCEGAIIKLRSNLDSSYQHMYPKISDDVTLGIIVRDELMNPAGGILSMLNQHINSFSNVVVLDTGSVDGTRELLEHLSGQYSHLKLYDGRFKGYAHARNKLNKKIKTKYTLALDADEMLFGKSLLCLVDFIVDLPDFDTIAFEFINVNHRFPSNKGRGWSERLYTPHYTLFSGFIGESHNVPLDLVCTGAPIHHFMPKSDAIKMKRDNWYDVIVNKRRLAAKKAPSEFEGFSDWKIPDILTLSSYGIDVFDVIKQIENMGIKFPDNLIPLKLN